MTRRILITGAAGFIGFHLAKSRLIQGDEIFGIDNLNDYYDVSLKKARLQILKQYPNFSFAKINLEDKEKISRCFQNYQPEEVVHLAAQAGVRYSIENPCAYIDSNIVGFNSILEACRHYKIKHLVYASSSSVYGANAKQPFSELDGVNHPMSLYAATKRANELMAHAYSSIFNLPTTGLRFFTVYGPWGRPDMALFKFTKNILEEKSIDIFNHGNLVRDFTYIDDIIIGINAVMNSVPEVNESWDKLKPDPGSSYCPYKIYNIGNSKPEALMSYVKAIEKAANIQAKINYLPMQPGDVFETYADVKRLEQNFSYKPRVSIQEGVKSFVEWYKRFYVNSMIES